MTSVSKYPRRHFGIEDPSKSTNPVPLTTSCHCGRVKITIPAAPTALNQCHCTVCYRYGTLWAYFQRGQVDVAVDPSTTLTEYIRSDEGAKGDIAFCSCAHCGCLTHWWGMREARKGPTAKMGINCRMLPEEVIQEIERHITSM